MEQATFIATQVAEFANDKTLYYKFLEEVSDPKLLTAQSPQESFALVQIMVKAGSQLINESGNLLTVEHEALLLRSLESMSGVLVEHREILLKPLTGNERGTLSSWLLDEFVSLLCRNFSETMNEALGRVIRTILRGLQSVSRSESIFEDSVYSIVDSVRRMAKCKAAVENGSRFQMQLRLLAILFDLSTYDNTLESQRMLPRLRHELEDAVVHLVQTSGLLLSVRAEDYSTLLMSLMLLTGRETCSFDPTHCRLRLQIFEQLVRLLADNAALAESGSQHAGAHDLDHIVQRLLKVSYDESWPSTFLARLTTATDALLSNPALVISASTRDVFGMCRAQYHASQTREKVITAPVAPIFIKNAGEPLKSCPLASELSDILELTIRRPNVFVILDKLDDFEQLMDLQQKACIQALGMTSCACAGNLHVTDAPRKSGLSFACTVCDKASTTSSLSISCQSVDHDAKRMFLQFAKMASFKDKPLLRVELMKTWQRRLRHSFDADSLNLEDTSILKHINMCLEDESRQVRVHAGAVLTEYFRYGDRDDEERVFLFNRRRVFDILRRHAPVIKLSETLLHTWTDLGRRARPDDLQLVLVTLVDYLCHSNMLIRQTAVAALYTLAANFSLSTYMLFSPYMRHISVQVLDRHAQNRDFMASFSKVLGISTADFLSRNQQYLLPPMILHGLHEHIVVIAQSTKRSVKQTVLDNIPFILSSLLTSGYIKDGSLMRFLIASEPSFQTISLDELVNSYPIPLAVELLQLLSDRSVKRESVMAAMSQVAHICGKVLSGTRKTPRDMALDNLRSFLHKHSLGIVSQCEESMNGYRGKRGILDRVRYIVAIGELINLIGQGIDHAVPQITAFLQTAMEEPGLRLSAITAWESLVSVVSAEVVAGLIPYSFCLFQNIWPACSDPERTQILVIMEHFLDEHQNILAKQIGLVPQLRFPELQSIEEQIAKFRVTTSLSIALKYSNQLIVSDNPVICEEGCRGLKSLLLSRQSEVYNNVLREHRDPTLNDSIRGLLDILVKFKGSNEQIQLLAADCLGIIGAVDPVRIDAAKKVTREVILHIFEDEDAEESVKFVRIFLETQLVNAFRSVTRSNVQIFLAWAIQELLKFSGLDESVVLLSDERSMIHDVEAKRRWRMFTPLAREVMTPLLSSKYDAGEQVSRIEASYPIFSNSPNYNSWLYLFIGDLLQSAAGENAKKLFGVFSRILREEETVISNFLLPYVFLNVCVGCQPQKRASLLLEMMTVLEPRTSTDSLNVEYTRLARESIFSVLDYMSLWIRSKKINNRDRLAERLKRQNRHMFPEDENDKDVSVKTVQTFLSSIPSKLIAEAALACGSYSRALFYWEQHLRNQVIELKHSKLELEPLYAQLQQLYININDPDGIEGVSSCLTDLTLEQEIMMHENAGRWTAAQSSYELALQAQASTDHLKVGFLNCLKQTGHHEVLIDLAEKYRQEEIPETPSITDMAVESSWILARWSNVAKLVDSTNEKSYSILLGSVLHKVHAQDVDTIPTAMLQLKRRVISDLSSSSLDSTWRCYDSLAKLSVVHELEHHLTDFTLNTVNATSSAVLRDRLLVMPTTSIWKQHLLSVRRTLINENKNNAARALSSIWLESAKLARKSGQSQQAYQAILNALKINGTPLAKIEHARWWWREGYQMRAIQSLRKAIDSKVFNAYEPDANDSISSMDASLLNSGKAPKVALISKAELLLTRWNDLAEHANTKQQLREYQIASRGSQLEKPHYYMGRFYMRLLEAESNKQPENQDIDYLQGEYHRQVIMSYGRAMHFGVKFIFETLPTYLQLWLDFGTDVRSVHQKAALTAAKRGELVKLRLSHLAHINEKLKGFVARLPTYLYMLAFPQILSRINHGESGCYAILESIILKCLTDYPKQALWPFMAVCKSRDPSRSSRGNSLIGRLRKDAGKQGNITRLTHDAQLLTDQLMHLCTVPVIKNRASLSLRKDLEFNMAVAPSNLVVPIQDNLTVVLPAQGAVGNTKHHKAFDEHQPTIASFKDEVDVMASLQKPRKITIKASDGQNYPFLVKPNDDLRKDARLMDFNGIVQKFIRKDSEALKRLLTIRTYAVIALNEDHGLCEWVRNTRPLRDILVKTYAARNIAMQYSEVKIRLEQCLTSSNPGHAFELHILKMFPPTFHDWFVEKFADPSQWFTARLSYSRTLAVMSMVGFVLGLGDRHGENILFDETTGDAVHVDFNCLFEKGHTFDKPERVPFRLTQNMVDALGVTGIEGSFRKTSEITLRILRTNQDAFNSVLESFLHDPVAEFTKKVKKSSSGDLEKGEAMKVLAVIANKLKGSAGSGVADKHTPLSIEGQADELIKQATDKNLLVQMYIGWTAWL